ncbi:TPA: hypothetical protein ACTUNV_002647 [Legionella pneumophila]
MKFQKIAHEDDSVVFQKLVDLLTPGVCVTFDPDEAAKAGAFIEDALDEQDAIESQFDLREENHHG